MKLGQFSCEYSSAITMKILLCPSDFVPVFACLHVEWGANVLWLIHKVVKMTLRQWESLLSAISDCVSSCLCQVLYKWWETRGHVVQTGILGEKLSWAQLLKKRPLQSLTQSCITYCCFLNRQKLHWTLGENMDHLTLPKMFLMLLGLKSKHLCLTICF